MGGVMSGGKGGKAPEAPDFTAAAERQGQSGRVNSPFAAWNGQTLDFRGGLGQGAENLMGQIGSQGALPTGMEARDQAITGAYNQAASRLDPQFSQREESLRAQLANQGLDPGSEAATAEMGNFGRQRNDAYSSAMANAIGQGTSAGNAIFQQGLQSQNAPYSQLGQLAGLLGVNNGPQTPYLNAANMGYQGALQSYGIDQAGKNSTLGGLAGLGGTLGGAALMAPIAPAAAPALAVSDERKKKNIERTTLEATPGVPFATWEWIDGPPGRFVGVIAQDLEKFRPEMVHTAPDGTKLVDYGFLDEVSHG
jgi:Chaperone of endosialidase